MNIHKLTGEDRRIAKLTIAINATIAQQVNDGRGHRPWIYNDTKRMLSVADLLDLDEVAAEQENGEHYGLVSAEQAPVNAKLDNVVKVLADQLNVELDEVRSEKVPVSVKVPKGQAA
jgi:hypothetical protein